MDADKITVITNGVDMSYFKPMPKDVGLVKNLGLEGKFVAGYLGTHGLAHHLETLLDAAEMLSGLRDSVVFHFILLGDGARKRALKEETARRGLDNITFLDSVGKDQVACYWSLLDASIIHLKKTELFTTVIPSKLFECMGMGLPVLHGVAGEPAEIVEHEGVGIVFEPENPADLVEHLRVLGRDPSAYEGYRVHFLEAAKKYDRTVIAREML